MVLIFYQLVRICSVHEQQHNRQRHACISHLISVSLQPKCFFGALIVNGLTHSAENDEHGDSLTFSSIHYNLYLCLVIYIAGISREATSFCSWSDGRSV